MRIEFSDKATKQLENIIDNHLEYCGKQSAIKFSMAVDKVIKSLTLFPESGHPEPILKHKEILYRARIINKNYKLVYCIHADLIRIAAVWDMRMNPTRLRGMV